MAARSLRAHLLRMLLPPIAALLGLGALIAYYPSVEPATEAYDQSLVDIGIALGSHIRPADVGFRLELPPAVEQVLRADRYDTIYYRVGGPDGRPIAGDLDLPLPAETGPGLHYYDTQFKDRTVRAVSMPAQCGSSTCSVVVAETTVKRTRMAREILVSNVLPEVLIALATVVIVWFGVKRGLAPLARLSEEIKERSPADLHALDVGKAPEETRPLIAALNGLLEELAAANRNQQRFLANAAHQLRTPLAGLQAHTELALSLPMPEACRTQVEQVHEATIRTARLANQLLALARAEPGGHTEPLSRVELKPMVEGIADEWVHRALQRDLDLGFDLEPAIVRGDEFLLREALANLLHNAIEYSPRGARITVRTGTREAKPYLEVEDDGPGIPMPERERVLDRFYRMPGTPGTGSGLGLAIVREIASGHGASIVIGDSGGAAHPTKGCRVALTFPHG
ncbi:MAG TPA: sensor histidine kinase N-terminal domain-containing protein [Burkholderiales bacterium]|nr:sensor histidine kinase N-terminal domain-containing protein [Burkholderiales bacterium]